MFLLFYLTVRRVLDHREQFSVGRHVPVAVRQAVHVETLAVELAVLGEGGVEPVGLESVPAALPAVQQLAGLGRRLATLVPHQPVPLAATRVGAAHEKAGADHPVPAGQREEGGGVGVGREARHAQPALAAPHAHPRLLVLDEDGAAAGGPGLQQGGPGQVEPGTGPHPPVPALHLHPGDHQVGQRLPDILEHG